jgi:hypothetical protein
MEQSKKEKGAINSTQLNSDSVKNQVQDTKTLQFPIKSKKIFVIKNLIPKSAFVIKIYNYQFKIHLIKS